MKIENTIKDNFSKKSLINTFAKYELYYQLASSVFVKDSSFKDEDISKKIEELNLDINVENILNTMLKIISSFYKEEDFEFIFEDNLRINAFLHALKDFLNKNNEIKNKEKVYLAYRDKIMGEEFYDMKMHIYFEEELKDRIEYWKTIVSDDLAKKLCVSAFKMI